MVKKLIFKSIKDISNNFMYILKIYFIYIILLFLIDYIASDFILNKEGIHFINIIFFLLKIFLLVTIDVNLFRMFILQERILLFIQEKSFTKKHFLIFFNIIKLMAIYLIPIVFSLMNLSRNAFLIFFLIYSILMLCFIARISLVFPALAIDDEMSLKQSWNYTKLYNFLILKIFVLYFLILCIFILLFFTVIKIFIANTLFLIFLFINLILVSVLSNVFMYIIYEIETKK